MTAGNNQNSVRETVRQENWHTISRLIRERMRHLHMSQAQLILRSRLSKAIVGELVNGVVRHRSPRTLAAISTGLGWDPDHLEAILDGDVPPAVPTMNRPPVVRVNSWNEAVMMFREIMRHIAEINEKIERLSTVDPDRES